MGGRDDHCPTGPAGLAMGDAGFAGIYHAIVDAHKWRAFAGGAGGREVGWASGL